MAKKTTSKTQKARYEVYGKESVWKKNREAKLIRHLEKHPEDAIAKAALSALDSAKAPRRAKHKNKDVMRTSGRVYAMIKATERAITRAAKSTFGKTA